MCAQQCTPSIFSCFAIVSGVSRAKIEEVTLNALRTRQSLVKGERLVRHEVRAVLRLHASAALPPPYKILIVGMTNDQHIGDTHEWINWCDQYFEAHERVDALHNRQTHATERTYTTF